MLGVDPHPPRTGQRPGCRRSPGDDIVETEISIDQLEDMLFEELELPNLEQKEKDQLQTTEILFHDIRKKGIMSNIDKKRTILENLRRNANAGKSGIHGISPDDLRYKTWDEIIKPQSNAVILAMMDTSGSMGHSRNISPAASSSG